jgi:hypothetical protein
MAVCHLVADGNGGNSYKADPMLRWLCPSARAGGATPATPLHRLFDAATISTDPEGCYTATARARSFWSSPGVLLDPRMPNTASDPHSHPGGRCIWCKPPCY